MQRAASTFFYLLSLFLILTKAGVAGEKEATDNVYSRLTALQCDSLVKANETNPNFVILDVRTETEWKSYHILGSIYRSTRDIDFNAQLNALPKYKTYLLHCQSGGRSAGAFAKMKELQFAEVHEMIGGINAWNSKGLPTSKITEPKLMLVSYSEILKGNDSDTIKITLTNRANGSLTFNSFSLSDIHSIQDDFNPDISLEGAQDYTFSIVHSPGYYGNDSTNIGIQSNGGMIDLDIVFKNGSILGIDEQQIAETHLFPNPANDKIYLKNSTMDHFDQILILNINGQIVQKESMISGSKGINVSGLKNGIYILQIKTGGKMFSKKIIVKH